MGYWRKGLWGVGQLRKRIERKGWINEKRKKKSLGCFWKNACGSWYAD